MEQHLEQKVRALHKLGLILGQEPDDRLQAVIRSAHAENAWFTEDNIQKAIEGIVQHFLQEDKLENWLAQYPQRKAEKRVGLILAGNIPLVGFHDLLCVYVSGHRALVKYSSKDEVLLKYILALLFELDPTSKEQITFVERLTEYDAVVATGSNNSSRYFEEYFAHVPNIIRRNRNGVAVVSGKETVEDFVALGLDIFTYFGLGCRNVSKIYVPKDYSFDLMLHTLHDHYKELVLHHKYKNNFDYNHALFMLNKEKFLMSGSLMVREAEPIQSRIASVNYEYYDEIHALATKLQQQMDEVQCIVSHVDIPGLPTYRYGAAQRPSLTDYADGVDTMSFLLGL